MRPLLCVNLDVVDKQTEQLVENEPSAVGEAEVEGLGEGVWRIVVRLQLANHVDHDALLHGDLGVHGGDAAADLLEGQALEFVDDGLLAFDQVALEGHLGCFVVRHLVF